MGKQPNAVKSPAQRLSRMEARREKLLVTIERTRRRFEKYDKGAKRALKDLAKHERTARRMDKALAKAKAEAADEAVEAVASRDRSYPASQGVGNDVATPLPQANDDDGGVPQFLKDAAAERNRKLQTLPDPKTLEKKRERKVIEKEVR